MVADTEDLENMDASELHARRLNAKEVLTPMKGPIFPVADGTGSENIHLNPGEPRQRRRTRCSSRRNRWVGSSSTPRQVSSWHDGEARGDFLVYVRKFHLPSSRGTPGQTVHADSFPIPQIFIDVTGTTDTTSDVMSGKNVEDYWNVDGERELSDAFY